MNFIKNLSFILLAIVLISCGSKNETSDKGRQNETNGQLTTNDNETGSASEGLLLAQIGKVEPASGPKTAPNFSWTFEGKETSLEDVSDNVIFLNFWATWCGPCIKEMPELSEIAEELEGKNFTMLGINVFQQPGAQPVDDFLKQRPVSYLVIDANEDLVNAYGNADGSELNAVPTSYIIKDGKIVETIVGSRSKAQFMEIINKYL